MSKIKDLLNEAKSLHAKLTAGVVRAVAKHLDHAEISDLESLTAKFVEDVIELETKGRKRERGKRVRALRQREGIEEGAPEGFFSVVVDRDLERKLGQLLEGVLGGADASLWVQATSSGILLALEVANVADKDEARDKLKRAGWKIIRAPVGIGAQKELSLLK